MSEWCNVKVRRELLEAFVSEAQTRTGLPTLSRASAVAAALATAVDLWDEQPEASLPRADRNAADLRRYARLSASVARLGAEVVLAVDADVEAPPARRYALLQRRLIDLGRRLLEASVAGHDDDVRRRLLADRVALDLGIAGAEL